jgi:hypothetical protein
VVKQPERRLHLRLVAVDGKVLGDAPPPAPMVDPEVERQRREIRRVKEQLRRLRAGL